MTECEICGRVLGEERKARIDGVVFSVCENCLKLGKEVHINAVQRDIPRPRPKLFPGENAVLAEGFGQRIKKAREAEGLTREELAARIQEYASQIRRAEHGIEIEEKAMKKLEKFLGIVLYEIPDSGESSLNKEKHPMEITLGDIAEIRRRRAGS